MSVERDPELGRALERAFVPPNAPYGAKRRVRRKLEERLARARPLVSTAAAVAIGALACALVLHVARSPTRNTPAPLHDHGERSLVTLSSARVLLRDRAALAVERDDATGAVLRLTSGSVLVHVKKGTGKSFEVVAGTTRVRVLGTVFGVALGAQGASVEVIEGKVELNDGSGTRSLAAGDAWPAGRKLFDDPKELELVRAPLPAAASSARTAPKPEPPEATSAGSGPTRSAPLASVPSSVRSPNIPSSAGAESAYSRARSLERDGQTQAALAAYAAIVEGGGASVEDALFALARVQARAGDQRAALGFAERYRGAFPAGRYARDNDVLVLNAHLALGDQVSALGEAERFLAALPNDPRAWRFRLVRAADRARRGDCAGALSDVHDAPDGAAKRSVLESCSAKPR